MIPPHSTDLNASQCFIEDLQTDKTGEAQCADTYSYSSILWCLTKLFSAEASKD